MDKQIVFIVTHYGCNSSPSDMWIPRSTIFTNYDEAYSYFLTISPNLNDEQNKAEQFVNLTYNHEDLTQENIIIENRVQLAGYCYGYGDYAKRPYGVVIARSIIKNTKK